MLLFRRSSLPDAGERVPLKRLDGQDMIGLTAGGPVGDLLNRELLRQGVSVREVVSNQTFYVAAALTRCGAGMAVVDEFTARAGSSVDTGVLHRPFSPPIRYTIQCVHLDDRPPSKAASQFITLFSQILRESRD